MPVDELLRIRSKLSELYQRRLVKSNHSIMELIVAAHLLARGYEVDVEHPLMGDSLVCDVYARKEDDDELIVEIETGFVPPENAVDPRAYRLARTVSKTARYSRFARRFALAAPVYHILQIPWLLVIPPDMRSAEELKALKALCDRYYRRPEISLEELHQARVHAIYVIDVDRARVYEVPPERYVKACSQLYEELGVDEELRGARG